MNWQTGQNIGPYLIEDIKEGGMGLVLLVKTATGQRVALKTFKPGAMESREVQGAFRQEAVNWILLSRHPNVVHARSIYENHGTMFVVAERIDLDSNGILTVADAIEKRGMSIWEIVRYGVQVCRALHWARTQLSGFVHRDIKPGNILLQGSTAKVNDFGLSGAACVAAKHMDVLPEAEGITGRPGQMDVWGRQAVGTPGYASPEVMGEDTPTVRSDIFSFGATLYHMATGQLPFSGPTASTFQQFLGEVCPSPTSLRPDLPADLEAFIMRCLSKSPQDRFADFLEGGKHLQQVSIDITGQRVEKSIAWDASIVNHVKSLRTLGENDLANAVLDKALQAPDDDIRCEAAVELSTEGHYKEAADIFTDILSSSTLLSYTKDNVRTYLGTTLFNAGRHDELLDMANDALEVPNERSQPFMRFYKGVALLEKGFTHEAKKEFRKAESSAPDSVDILHGIGVGWLHQNRLKLAKQYLSKAVDLDSEHVPSVYNLALTCEQLGHRGEATVFFRRFLDLEKADHAWARHAKQYIGNSSIEGANV